MRNVTISGFKKLLKDFFQRFLNEKKMIKILEKKKVFPKKKIKNTSEVQESLISTFSTLYSFAQRIFDLDFLLETGQIAFSIPSPFGKF